MRKRETDSLNLIDTVSIMPFLSQMEGAIKQYDEDEVYTPSLVELRKAWEDFNVDFFDGQLEPIDIFLTTKQAKYVAQYYHPNINNRGGRSISRRCIVANANFKLSKTQFFNTLLHEMVHQYVVEILQDPTAGHKRGWKDKAMEINKSSDWTITPKVKFDADKVNGYLDRDVREDATTYLCLTNLTDANRGKVKDGFVSENLPDAWVVTAFNFRTAQWYWEQCDKRNTQFFTCSEPNVMALANAKTQNVVNLIFGFDYNSPTVALASYRLMYKKEIVPIDPTNGWQPIDITEGYTTDMIKSVEKAFKKPIESICNALTEREWEALQKRVMRAKAKGIYNIKSCWVTIYKGAKKSFIKCAIDMPEILEGTIAIKGSKYSVATYVCENENLLQMLFRSKTSTLTTASLPYPEDCAKFLETKVKGKLDLQRYSVAH